MFPPHSALARLILLLILLPTLVVQAVPRNVSIDDSAAEISYTGPWDRISAGTNGFHHRTSSSAAFAIFRFRGTALYFMSPKWSYPVGADLSLGPGRAGVVSLDLQDYSGAVGNPDGVTQESAVVASYPSLPGNVDYELRVSVGFARPFAVVDEIIITVDDDDDNVTIIYTTVRSTAPSTTQTIAPPDESGSPTVGGLSVAAIAAIGAVGGAVVLLLITILIFCILRRRRRQNQSQGAGNGQPSANSHQHAHHPPAPQAVVGRIQASQPRQQQQQRQQQQHSTAGVFNPVIQNPNPSTSTITPFDTLTYRSGSDANSTNASRRVVAQSREKPGHTPSNSGDGRSSIASGSTGVPVSSSSAGLYYPSTLSSQLRLANGAEADRPPPPDYEEVMRAGNASNRHRVDKGGVVLRPSHEGSR